MFEVMILLVFIITVCTWFGLGTLFLYLTDKHIKAMKKANIKLERRYESEQKRKTSLQY